jgi:hypothetical protein
MFGNDQRNFWDRTLERRFQTAEIAGDAEKMI